MPKGPFAYRIDFENEPNAAAPAQQVVITDPLSSDLDWTTFQLTEIGFGDQLIAVPMNSQHFETNVPMTYLGATFDVQIEAGIRVASGQVYAIFHSVDPTTSLPPPVNIGMLPPEDGTGRGQGHFSYLIKPKPGLPTGTQIRNIALISFDGLPAIATNQRDPHDPSKGTDPAKEALNTIDAAPPTSTVAPLDSPASNAVFTVTWSGSDLGAGITGFDIYVSTNGGPWVQWLSDTNATNATFHGTSSRTYAFHSVARDGAGHTEAPPTTADAQTITPSNSAPLLSPVPDQIANVARTLIITNIATDPDTPPQTVTFTLDPGFPSGATINPTNGIFRWTPTPAQASTTNVITVWVRDNGASPLSSTVSFIVIVTEYLEPGLGGLILRAGEQGSLPITLTSSVGLTNLAMILGYPPERLTNIAVLALAPQVGRATNSPAGTNRMAISIGTLPGQVLQGTQQVALLQFTTVSNQHSAFVPLPISDVLGLKSDGSAATNIVIRAGRLVIIGDDPLLEAFRPTDGLVQVFLYAPAGSTNVVQTSPDLPAASWTPWQQTAMTNLLRALPPLPATNRTLFIRAVRP